MIGKKFVLIGIVSIFFFFLACDVFAGCVVPTNGMTLSGNVTLCPGTYNLPNGLEVASGATITCDNTTIIGDDVSAGFDLYGAQGNGSDNVTIRNCRVRNYGSGISGWHSSNITIENNTFVKTRYAFHLHDTESSTFRGNIIRNCQTAVRLWWGTNDNVFQNNDINNCPTGFYFDWIANDNLFKGNKIQNSNEAFFHAANYYGTVYRNIFVENEISDSLDAFSMHNTENSIFIRNRLKNIAYNSFGLFNSTKNKIYYNLMINVSSDPLLSSGLANIWNRGGFGNYWSNYDTNDEGCIDADVDGICDSPYVLAPTNKDKFPLTSKQMVPVLKSCAVNSDCGTNSWLNQKYCDSNNVWDYKQKHICGDPGTQFSYCAHDNVAKLRETCAYGCLDGACITP